MAANKLSHNTLKGMHLEDKIIVIQIKHYFCNGRERYVLRTSRYRAQDGLTYYAFLRVNNMVGLQSVKHQERRQDILVFQKPHEGRDKCRNSEFWTFKFPLPKTRR